MPYDLVISNGVVIDGSGLPRYRADVGVRDGRIAAVGRIREGAREVLDAEGRVVAPGFVDGHTHMDAQVFWDPLGTCSSWHGVTSVVMGNCGFTLAPCAFADRRLVMRNLERAEDISAAAMDAGIEWTWTTFPEYLDRLAALPKGINYASYLGASWRRPSGPARSGSPRRARRATRLPTGDRWRAASRRGTRCAGWSA
jgi:N-acyl-D-aspartate/D-glutamate deacylase